MNCERAQEMRETLDDLEDDDYVNIVTAESEVEITVHEFKELLDVFIESFG